MSMTAQRREHAIETLKQSLVDLDRFVAERQDDLSLLVVHKENGLQRMQKKRQMLEAMMENVR
ncbi:hypothetical protein [Magnetococcus sp. PR-3]|uniref:hypothetical protein n=1 Tax=Magnetococcus sp. PR-3 TaxID=3120355 RepID=UPI002FCDFB69